MPCWWRKRFHPKNTARCARRWWQSFKPEPTRNLRHPQDGTKSCRP
jgi:hypothetical protein